MSTRTALPIALLVVAIGTAACGASAASSAPSAAPSGSAVVASSAPSPTVAGIDHPTGADEVVLRYDSAGGFVPPEFLAARLPFFTLYGDGRVVFVRTTAEMKPRPDNVSVGQPVRTGVLSEDEIQALLEYALEDGGLALAKTEYQNQMVADAPTAVFTINAAGDSKTVSANGLGMQGQQGPDSAILERLNTLAQRLADFDQGGKLASQPYQAGSYRGVILEQQAAGVQVREWPWTDVAPADFTLPADANALRQGTKTLTKAQAAAVGIDGFENGVSSGVSVKGPDGKTYSLVIRPLLPDEKA